MDKNRYFCSCCNFNTYYKNDYTRHLNSKKHNIVQACCENPGTTPNVNSSPNAINKIYKCDCNDVFLRKYTLTRHQLNCTTYLSIKLSEAKVEEARKRDLLRASDISDAIERDHPVINKYKGKHKKNTDTDTSSNYSYSSQDHIPEPLPQPQYYQQPQQQTPPQQQQGFNNNDMTAFMMSIFQLIKNNNDEIKDMVLTNKKETTTNITNNNNTLYQNNNNIDTFNNNNNNFTLNFFLNEHCKDAMSIDEFVKNYLKINTKTFENTGRLGYVDGITKIFIDGINSLDIKQRPFHCTDVSREVFYIKGDELWEQDDSNNTKLMKAINDVMWKNIDQAPLWENEHPDSKNTESPTFENYLIILKEAFGGDTKCNDEIFIKKKNKILKNIAQAVYVRRYSPIAQT